MRNKKTRIAVLIAVILVAIGAVIYGIWNRLNRPTPIPAGQSSAAPTSHTPTTFPSDRAWPAECPTNPQPIADPVQFTLLAQHRQLPMISVGRDADGAAGAPPGDQPETIAWFNEGPRVGSAAGQVVLTSHTYHLGGAFGNELNDGLLQIGDVILINDAAGNAACYSYSGSAHVLVAEYDPDSDLVYSYDSSPRFALVVCSDYTPGGDTLGRMIYYGELMTQNSTGQQTADSGQTGTSMMAGGNR